MIKYSEYGNLNRLLIQVENVIPPSVIGVTKIGQIADISAGGPNYVLPLTSGATDIAYTVTWTPTPGIANVIVDLEMVVSAVVTRFVSGNGSFNDSLRNFGASPIDGIFGDLIYREGVAGANQIVTNPIRLRNRVANTGVFNGILRIGRTAINTHFTARTLNIDRSSISVTILNAI